jgi:flavodoxin
MKSLVVYSSKTGNTKKLAETIFEALPGGKEIYTVNDAPDPTEYNLVCIAFWFQGGKPDPKSQEFMAKINDQKVILAATHGAAKGSAHAKNGLWYAKELVPSAEVLASYNCQGEVNEEFLKKAAAKPEPPPWISDAPGAKGHPDANDLAELKELVAKAI